MADEKRLIDVNALIRYTKKRYILLIHQGFTISRKWCGVRIASITTIMVKVFMGAEPLG